MRLLKIGRDASCNIVMHSDKVSSIHAELTILNSGDMMLEDKGSRNGTYIMNQRIAPNKPVNIKRGDAVRFADVELQWSQVPMPEDNSAYRAVYGIGSHFNNEIQISGSTVSRYHATVKQGKDGKMYIIDHSKNGTTVNGAKITSNTPFRINKSSSVVCGGVPVDLSQLPWKNDNWKVAAGIAASVAAVVGLAYLLWTIIPKSTKEYDDGQLYALYNNSVVYIEGIYHYHVTGVPDEKLEEYGLPENFFITESSKGKSLYPVNSTAQLPSYSATGFFVSQDGQIITNLHVVKPWLFDNNQAIAEEVFKKHFAQNLSLKDYQTQGAYGALTGDAVYISQLKVEGVLDGLLFVPQGKYYSNENAVMCRVLSAGDDINKDVALIQSEKGELPHGARYINVTDSLDCSNEALAVGNHVYTIGFPDGNDSFLQRSDNEKGLQVIAQGGNIIQQDSEFDFGYNAPTTGGASGSPVFNKYGMLIGVHHAGKSKVAKHGYNYGIKAQYVKELLEKPHKK